MKVVQFVEQVESFVAIALHALPAMASSLLVVLPIAETTTTGLPREPGPDDRGDTLDGGRRFDRRAAELHDDH